MNNQILEAALACVRRGWAVFPCKPDKSPYTPHGFKDASRDEKQIKAWWTRWPDAMIGLPTGTINGVWALDIDRPKKAGDADGIETLTALEQEHGKLPETMRQRTPSGGEHHFFQYSDDCKIGSSVRRLGSGLDVRAEGGYVICSPSKNHIGKYELVADVPPVPAPQWLLDMMLAKQKTLPAAAAAQADAKLHPYIGKALENAMREIATAPEGKRNDTLFREVASLAGFIPEGYLDEGTLRQKAEAAYRECNPEDWDKEFEATFGSAVERGKQTQREIPSKLPPGFTLKNAGADAGVWYKEQTRGGEEKDIWLGTPLAVRGWIRDNKSENWSKLVEWHDPDGIRHSVPISGEMLASTDSSGWRKVLASGGYRFAAGRKCVEHIGEYLGGCQPVARFMGVNRTGWHENSFVLPDRTFSKKTNEKIIMYNAPFRNPYQMAGTLSDWQENVGKYAAGNSRLIFALCAAFAAPLLHLLGQESAGFNFVGASSTGKSTALYMAASVWGKGASGDGYVLPWRTTDNGLEAQAALHSDTLLCLDEMSQAAAPVIREAAYMLGNSQGKARANRKGDSREVKNWRVIFLSTGEQGLESKLLEDGKRARAGQAVRLLDIPADAGRGMGLFDNIGEANSASAFADVIRKSSATWHGTAGRAFLERLAGFGVEAKVQLEGVYAAFCNDLCPGGEDGQVRRAGAKFALCWLAGLVAAYPGQKMPQILQIALGEIEWAIKNCFAAWVNQRGGTGAWENKNIIETALAFIQTQASRFQTLGALPSPFEGTPANRAGFRVKDEAGRTFYIFPATFEKEICNGMPTADAAKILYEAGHLLKEDGRWMKKLPRDVEGLGRQRMYALRVADPE